MYVAGIDYSTFAVDVVLVHLDDLERPKWDRFPTEGHDAFERARLTNVLPRGHFWDDVVAIGIEDPRGYNAGALYRIQGAILSRLPRTTLVQPWAPNVWRKAVGLPGNATKERITQFVAFECGGGIDAICWPQDACDAYCIALATRQAIEAKAA
jgi:hypothetical protein